MGHSLKEQSHNYSTGTSHGQTRRLRSTDAKHLDPREENGQPYIHVRGVRRCEAARGLRDVERAPEDSKKYQRVTGRSGLVLPTPDHFESSTLPRRSPVGWTFLGRTYPDPVGRPRYSKDPDVSYPTPLRGPLSGRT